jgi:thiol-disulfide isomerase/thioredoxin
MMFLVFLGLLLGTTQGGLQELTPAQVEGFIDSNHPEKSVVLMFHVNWCGSCKRTLPEFAKASTLVDPSAVVMAAVDVTDQSAFNEASGISAFPQLRMIARGAKSIPIKEWTNIPYYMRVADRMVDFIARIDGPESTIVKSASEFGVLINTPKNGHVVSTVVVGQMPNLADSKLRSQILHVKDRNIWKSILAESRGVSLTESTGNCADFENFCIFVIPKPSALVTGSPVIVPSLKASKATNIDIPGWILRHGRPGLWSVEDSQFQEFNDRAVLKVFVAQTSKWPNSSAANSTIINELSQCFTDLSGRAALGLLDGVSFQSALADFGIDFKDQPRVLVLSEKELDYNRYFDIVTVGSICEGVSKVLRGEGEMKFRGGWFAKLNFRFTAFLDQYGMNTELYKNIVLFSLVGVFCLMLAGLMGLCIKADSDPVRKKQQ